MARRINTQLVIEGKDDTGRAMRQVQKNLDAMNKRAEAIGNSMGAALAGLVSYNSIKRIAEINDSFSQMEGRLRLVTESQEDFNKAQEGLNEIAKDTQTALEPIYDLYTKMIRPLKEAGRTQEEALVITRAISQAFSISGASSAEAANGVTQLSQAMAVGVLRGQDFNSVAAFAPRLMQAFADSLEEPQGKLKDLAAEGVLTTEVMANALLEQANVMAEEYAKIPSTVSGALQNLQTAFEMAIAGADMQPLIDSINEFTDRISDPQVVEALTRIASAMVSVVSGIASGAEYFVGFADHLAFSAAKASGLTTELDEVDKKLKSLRRAASGKFTIKGLILTDDKIKKEIEALEAAREKIITELTGFTVDERKLEHERKKELDSQAAARLEAMRKHSSSVKSIQRELLDGTKAHLKELVKAERDAQKNVDKARKQQLDTEKRYKDALAILRGEKSTGDPSYLKALDLQTEARGKLKKGDTKGAKESAQAALQMLLDLKEAGENSYGFAGIALQLQEIEKAADKIDLEKAELELDTVKLKMEEIKRLTDELKSVTVAVEMDQESFNKVKAQLEQLGGIMGKATIIPELPSAPGFANGGLVRGAGTGTSDSILARLSNGEYVMRAAAVQQYGKTLLDNMNGLKVPKFNTGGMVGDLQARQTPSLGTLNFHLPSGDSFSVGVADGDLSELKRAALKYGRTKK